MEPCECLRIKSVGICNTHAHAHTHMYMHTHMYTSHTHTHTHALTPHTHTHTHTHQELVAYGCSWCGDSYHISCFKEALRFTPCLLGPHRHSIVPPSWIVRTPAVDNTQVRVRIRDVCVCAHDITRCMYIYLYYTVHHTLYSDVACIVATNSVLLRSCAQMYTSVYTTVQYSNILPPQIITTCF